MKALHLVGLVVLLAACAPLAENGPAMADVRLNLDPAPAAAGDSTSLVLSNESAQSVGYNLCVSQLEQWDGDAWRPVPEGRVCTMELRILDPGGTARFGLSLPPALAPGEYRYSTRLEMMDTGETDVVRSESFRVAA
jgi:hypothetical protein